MRIGVALRTVAGEDAVIYDRTAPTNVHSAAQRSVVAVVAAVGTVAAECAVCNRRAGVIGGHAAAVIVFASFVLFAPEKPSATVKVAGTRAEAITGKAGGEGSEEYNKKLTIILVITTFLGIYIFKKTEVMTVKKFFTIIRYSFLFLGLSAVVHTKYNENKDNIDKLIEKYYLITIVPALIGTTLIGLIIK